jgi:hypothetical protein
MHTTYTVYHADGTIQRGEVEWPDAPSAQEIRALVEPIVGSPMEHVTVLDPVMAQAEEISRADYRDMFVDELGHVRVGGPKQRNHAATAIYRANWLRAKGGNPEELHWIAGTAVMFDRIVWK